MTAVDPFGNPVSVAQPRSRAAPAQPESRRIARLLAEAWRRLDAPRFAG